MIGLGVILLSLGVLGYLAFLKFYMGQAIGGRPLLSLGFFGLLGGVQFLTFGVLAELLIRIYYGARYASPYVVRSTDSLETVADHEAWAGEPSAVSPTHGSVPGHD